MISDLTCPECGERLPADAPRGHCPACLLKAGLARDTSEAHDPVGSEPIGHLDVSPRQPHRGRGPSRARSTRPRPCCRPVWPTPKPSSSPAGRRESTPSRDRRGG
jgi:hypothetical protein